MPNYRGPGRPTGPNYGRSYDNRYMPRPTTTYRPIRTQYGTRYYHRPFGYSPVRYNRYYTARTTLRTTTLHTGTVRMTGTRT